MRRSIFTFLILVTGFMFFMACEVKEELVGWRYNEETESFEQSIDGVIWDHWEDLYPLFITVGYPQYGVDDLYLIDFPDTPWSEVNPDLRQELLDRYESQGHPIGRQIYVPQFNFFKPEFYNQLDNTIVAEIDGKELDIVDFILQSVNSWGMNMIRMPIHPHLISNPKQDYEYPYGYPELNPEYVANVADFLYRAHKQELSLLLEFHIPPAYALKAATGMPGMPSWPNDYFYKTWGENYWCLHNLQYVGSPGIEDPHIVQKAWGRYISESVYQISCKFGESDESGLCYAPNLFGVEIVGESMLLPQCDFKDGTDVCNPETTPNDPQEGYWHLIRAIKEQDPLNPLAPWNKIIVDRNQVCPDCENPFIGSSIFADPCVLGWNFCQADARLFTVGNLDNIGFDYHGLSWGWGGEMDNSIDYSVFLVRRDEIVLTTQGVSPSNSQPNIISETSAKRYEAIWFDYAEGHEEDFFVYIHPGIGDPENWFLHWPEDQFYNIQDPNKEIEPDTFSRYCETQGQAMRNIFATMKAFSSLDFKAFGFWDFGRSIQTRAMGQEYAENIYNSTFDPIPYPIRPVIWQWDTWDFLSSPQYSRLPAAIMGGAYDDLMPWELPFDCGGLGNDTDHDNICDDPDNCTCDDIRLLKEEPMPPLPCWNPANLDSDLDYMGDRCDEDWSVPIIKTTPYAKPDRSE